MPELAEVEAYRRLAERVVGRTIAEVVAPDAWYLKRGVTAPALEAALVGRTVTDTRRVGKLLLLEFGDSGLRGLNAVDGPVLGLRFGMSGRLLVDGRAAITDLAYASNRELERWDRFALRFDGR